MVRDNIDAAYTAPEGVLLFVSPEGGIQLEYDSNTLPVLDHYLRTVPDDQPAALELVVATSGAYFGEVVRKLLGGLVDERNKVRRRS